MERVALIALLSIASNLASSHSYAQEQPQTVQPSASTPTFPDPGKPPGGYVYVVVKLFNANDPTSNVPLIPGGALVFSRNLQTQAPQLDTDTSFELIPGSTQFYKLAVRKDRLIDQIVIEVSSGNANFNPAVISKVVSKNLMVLYPGASRPDEQHWNFHVWMGQMGAYQTVLSQLLDEEPIPRERILEAMRARFGAQLKTTAYAARSGKLVGANNKPLTPAQDRAARDLATKVLDLYGIEKLPMMQAKPCPQATHCEPCCQPSARRPRCRCR